MRIIPDWRRQYPASKKTSLYFMQCVFHFEKKSGFTIKAQSRKNIFSIRKSRSFKRSLSVHPKMKGKYLSICLPEVSELPPAKLIFILFSFASLLPYLWIPLLSFHPLQNFFSDTQLLLLLALNVFCGSFSPLHGREPGPPTLIGAAANLVFLLNMPTWQTSLSK